jgi:hypothetical protein
MGSVLAVAVTLAACGSSSGSSAGGSSTSGGTKASGSTTGKTSGSGKLDICAIITPADAEKVFGGPAKQQAPTSSELKLSSACIYKKDTTDIAVNLLQVRVYDGPQFYGASIFPKRRSVKVSGADESFLSVKTVPGGTAQTFDLQFVKNDRTGAINYVATKGADEATVVPALTAIANKVAAAI